jgi:hypothetical protein
MDMTGAAATKQNSIVILVMSAVLIGGLASAVIIPAGEFPPYGYALFNMGLDALMTVLLGVLVFAEQRAAPSALRRITVVLGPLGFVAGLAQFAIRFTSDHAWWTGHYLAPVFN